jgi:transporter family-2 protein
LHPLTFAIALPAVAFLGALAAFSSAVNGLVGRELGTFRATSLFLMTGALLCVPIILIFERAGFAKLFTGLPWYLYLPGLINIFLIANLIFVVNRIGTMLMTSAMFSGQVVVSLLLDNIGFLGLPIITASPLRWAAGFVLILGILIAASSSRSAATVPSTGSPRVRALALGLAFLQGSALAAISGLNAVLGMATGTFTSTFLFLAPGGLFLTAWFALKGTPVRIADVRAMFFLPGSLNVVGIAGGVVLVPIVGLQFTTAARVTASVLSGLYIDRRGLFGLPTQPVSTRRILGTIVLAAGVILTVFG